MPKTLLTITTAAALVAAFSLPAAAQRATAHQSFEGATAEMQKKGPRSSMYGPMSDGRIVVTNPGSRRYVKRHRHHTPRYYGMGR